MDKNTMLVAVISGSVLIIMSLFWFIWESKSKINNSEKDSHALLFQYIKSIGKVVLLMFGALLIGLPLIDTLISSGVRIEESVQVFNGVSAVIIGLAIAGAGAWVSIRLAHVATEIASNHFYSEESKKRYDEAFSAAELMKELDLCISDLLIKSSALAERLCSAQGSGEKIHKNIYYKSLKMIAEDALNLAKIYQRVLNVPTLIEIISSEYSAVKKIRNKDSVLCEILKYDHPSIVSLETHLKTLEYCFIVHGVMHENKPHPPVSSETPSSNDDDHENIVYTAMKNYSEVIHKQSLKLIQDIESNTLEDVEKIQRDIAFINSKTASQFTDIGVTKKESSELIKVQQDTVLGFYILEYFFTQGYVYVSEIQNIQQEKYDNKGAPSYKSQYTEEERNEDSDDSEKTKCSIPQSNEPIASNDKGKSNATGRKMSDQGELDTDVNRSLDGSEQSGKLKANKVDDDHSDEEGSLVNESNTFQSDNSLQTTESLRPFEISAQKFAAAMYMLPRLPRELLKIDNDPLRLRNVMNTVYAGHLGVDILKEGRASSQESSLQERELQLYIYRSLAVSKELGDRIIVPFQLLVTKAGKRERNNGAFTKIGTNIDVNERS